MTDPISELILTSSVPDPIIGETLQRTMRPTVEGKEGLATHLNILVDKSGSMGDGLYYGISNTGYPMAGYHLAQICCAMMIAQAEIAKDTFAVWAFNGGSEVVWLAHRVNTKWLLIGSWITPHKGNHRSVLRVEQVWRQVLTVCVAIYKPTILTNA